jgi:beta-xylosidase
VAQGDFAITTHVLFEPNTNFQLAGLVIYQDENNYLQFGRAFCNAPGACAGNGIYFDNVVGGNFTGGNFTTSVESPNEAYLRLEGRGDLVKALFSHDGVTWIEIGTHGFSSDFQINGVGLTSVGDTNPSDKDIPADFDFFELSENPDRFKDSPSLSPGLLTRRRRRPKVLIGDPRSNLGGVLREDPCRAESGEIGMRPFSTPKT